MLASFSCQSCHGQAPWSLSEKPCAQKFRGLIDDVKVWNCAKAPEELGLPEVDGDAEWGGRGGVLEALGADRCEIFG